MARRETLQKFEAEYSKLQAGEDWWDPDHEVSKFNVWTGQSSVDTQLPLCA